MKDTFQEFYEMLKLDRKNSSWSREDDFHKRWKELLSEVNEMEEGFKNNDFENVKEELGDALWDLLFLFVIAEEQGADPKEIIQNAMEKLKRRKPWIFTGEEVSKDEESRRWAETKKLEKERGLR